MFSLVNRVYLCHTGRRIAGLRQVGEFHRLDPHRRGGRSPDLDPLRSPVTRSHRSSRRRSLTWTALASITSLRSPVAALPPGSLTRLSRSASAPHAISSLASLPSVDIAPSRSYTLPPALPRRRGRWGTQAAVEESPHTSAIGGGFGPPTSGVSGPFAAGTKSSTSSTDGAEKSFRGRSQYEKQPRYSM